MTLRRKHTKNTHPYVTHLQTNWSYCTPFTVTFCHPIIPHHHSHMASLSTSTSGSPFSGLFHSFPRLFSLFCWLLCSSLSHFLYYFGHYVCFYRLFDQFSRFLFVNFVDYFILCFVDSVDWVVYFLSILFPSFLCFFHAYQFPRFLWDFFINFVNYFGCCCSFCWKLCSFCWLFCLFSFSFLD